MDAFYGAVLTGTHLSVIRFGSWNRANERKNEVISVPPPGIDNCAQLYDGPNPVARYIPKMQSK